MKTATVVGKSQVELLTFIAKYRFVTASHVQRHFGYISRTSVSNKLKRLVLSGHLAMKYDVSKKLYGIPAVYYLTTKGLRVLQPILPYITEATIKGAYGDRNASESLIQGSADLFELAHTLTRTYPNMKALTARQLGDITYFPHPLPSLYLAHKQGKDSFRFFLYYFRDVTRYDVAINTAVARLMKYRKADTYSRSGNDFPVILFVCETAAIERHAQRSMRRALTTSYAPLLVYTTNYQALVNLQQPGQFIWSNINDPGILISLEAIEA